MPSSAGSTGLETDGGQDPGTETEIDQVNVVPPGDGFGKALGGRGPPDGDDDAPVGQVGRGGRVDQH